MAETLTGVLSSIKWRSPDEDNDFTIAQLRTGETIKGNASQNSLIVGLTYTFQGDWKDDKEFRGQKQRSFHFSKLQVAEPHTRQGIISYLSKFAPGIGPTISGRLFDQFGDRAALVLRTSPAEAAESVKGLSLEVATEAAQELQKNAKFEEVRIDLTELFHGRGFSNQLITAVIRKWGVKAAAVIRRDPFCLLVAGFPSCGFARCDRMYLELQRKPYRLKRLMICIWHQLRSDMEGHTWHEGRKIIENLRQQAVITDGEFTEGRSSQGIPNRKQVSPNERIKKALELGVRSGWLQINKDSAGQIWIAEGEAATNEAAISEHLKRLILNSYSDRLDGEENTERQEGLQLLAYQKAVAECGDSAPDEIEHFEPSGKELTADQKIAVGKKTGICQFCGRQLLKEESKKRGYGPICAERNGLPWGETADQSSPAGTSPDEVSRHFQKSVPQSIPQTSDMEAIA